MSPTTRSLLIVLPAAIGALAYASIALAQNSLNAPEAQHALDGSNTQVAAIGRMKDEIQRNWNPNCDVEGGGDVQIRVSFKLTPDGKIAGQVKADAVERSSVLLAQAAAQRAIRAVYQSAPFEGLPPDYYGPQLNLNFKARDACAAR